MTSVEAYGVVLLAPDQTTMMFARGVHHIKSSLKPTTTTTKAGKAPSSTATVVEVVVLDFDYQNKVVEVSMRDTLVESATKAAAASVTTAVAVSKKNKSSKSSAITATAGGGVLTVMGSRVRARVELVKPK